MIKYIFINLSRLPPKEPSQHFSSSERKFTTRLSQKTHLPKSPNWLKSLVRCGKMSINLPKKDLRLNTKKTKLKLLNKKLPMLINMARSKRRKRKNTLRKNEHDCFSPCIYLSFSFFNFIFTLFFVNLDLPKFTYLLEFKYWLVFEMFKFNWKS